MQEIRTKEDQTFLFSAENNEEKEVWMGQLSKNMDM